MDACEPSFKEPVQQTVDPPDHGIDEIGDQESDEERRHDAEYLGKSCARGLPVIGELKNKQADTKCDDSVNADGKILLIGLETAVFPGSLRRLLRGRAGAVLVSFTVHGKTSFYFRSVIPVIWKITANAPHSYIDYTHFPPMNTRGIFNKMLILIKVKILYKVFTSGIPVIICIIW